MSTGVLGGWVGYRLVRTVGGSPPRRDPCTGAAYENRSKLEALFGPRIWREIDGKIVVDFGCGTGAEAVEIAERGARQVIGLDLRERVLVRARERAQAAGVADRCLFTTTAAGRADVVISIDAFEHFEDPAAILETMKKLLRPGGRILVAFGPPWGHPLGGHLFSVFPWAHLVVSERALMRWWSEFSTDGATRFAEIDGGLNQMTVRRFRRLVAASGLVVEEFTPVPIRRFRWLHVGPGRELFTSIVRCTLRLDTVPVRVAEPERRPRAQRVPTPVII